MRHHKARIRQFGLICVILLFGTMGCHHHHQQLVALPPPGSVPTELNKISLPPYVVEPPDVLLIEAVTRAGGEGKKPDPSKPPVALYPQPISGQHLVGPDGTVNLGVYGRLPVEGLTVEQIQEAVREFVRTKVTPPIEQDRAAEVLLVNVEVLAYNSKKYHVITDGAGFGEQAYNFPITGNEFVLDAITNIQGIPSVGSKRNIWVARRSPHGGHDQILPVDWVGISQHGITKTNYQLLPGDRVYVKAERVFRVNNWLDKVLAPIDRVFGSVLLGSTTVNSIQGRGLGGGLGGF